MLDSQLYHIALLQKLSAIQKYALEVWIPKLIHETGIYCTDANVVIYLEGSPNQYYMRLKSLDSEQVVHFYLDKKYEVKDLTFNAKVLIERILAHWESVKNSANLAIEYQERVMNCKVD